MKNIIKIIFSFVLLGVLVACSNPVSEQSKVEKNSGNVLYASFYPMEYLSKRIVGNEMEIRELMPASATAHTWEPTAKQLSELSQSKGLFINGAGLEGWLNKFQDNIKGLNIIDSSKGIQFIEHHEVENHEGETHGNNDPHFWLSPKSILVQAKNIYEAISEIDPSKKEIFTKNYNELRSDLEELDKAYTEELQKSKIKSIIVPHEAFSYIERDYGISQIPLSGVHGEGSPDINTMKTTINKAKELGIKDVFYEDGSSSEIADSIVKETGGKALPISTLEGLTQEQINGGEDYLSLLRKNLDNIVEATS